MERKWVNKLGLDISLMAEKRFRGETAQKIKEIANIKDDSHYITVKNEVAYWRKANQVHKFFVNKCHNGQDDQEDFYVSMDDLKDLLDICKRIKKEAVLVDGKIAESYTFNDKGERVYNYVDGKVIKNTELCETLLPTTQGFFFGSTDYDEWYLEQIEDTITQLETIIKNDDGQTDYIYSCSW